MAITIFIFILLIITCIFSFAGSWKENDRAKAHNMKRSFEFWVFTILGIAYGVGSVLIWLK